MGITGLTGLEEDDETQIVVPNGKFWQFKLGFKVKIFWTVVWNAFAIL